MSEGVPAVEEESPGRLFVPSLALTSYAEQNLNLFLLFFLLDIALTFGVSVGAASQIGAIFCNRFYDCWLVDECFER